MYRYTHQVRRGYCNSCGGELHVSAKRADRELVVCCDVGYKHRIVRHRVYDMGVKLRAHSDDETVARVQNTFGDSKWTVRFDRYDEDLTFGGRERWGVFYVTYTVHGNAPSDINRGFYRYLLGAPSELIKDMHLESPKDVCVKRLISETLFNCDGTVYIG